MTPARGQMGMGMEYLVRERLVGVLHWNVRMRIFKAYYTIGPYEDRKLDALWICPFFVLSPCNAMYTSVPCR